MHPHSNIYIPYTYTRPLTLHPQFSNSLPNLSQIPSKTFSEFPPNPIHLILSSCENNKKNKYKPFWNETKTSDRATLRYELRTHTSNPLDAVQQGFNTIFLRFRVFDFSLGLVVTGVLFTVCGIIMCVWVYTTVGNRDRQSIPQQVRFARFHSR